VQDLCAKAGALFMVDEIQTGLCRTGRFWAHQHFGLTPDVITCAKGLANGLPMGAVLATPEVAKGFVPGSHATTFGGGPLLSVVAAKVIEIMRRDHLDERAARLGAYAMEKFQDLKADFPGKIAEVRGLGLMLGIELAQDGKPVWEKLLSRGFILNLTQGTVLRLLPPLIIAEEDLDRFTLALADVLSED
jgi:acetylornithine aminotransferase